MLAQSCPRCRSPRVQQGYQTSPWQLRLIGVYELLCNNCSLEFRGLAVPGLIRRRPSTRRERPGNRQQAPRVKARLPLTVAVIEGNLHSNDTRYSPPLEGYTRDLSKVGLSFVIPSIILRTYNFADPTRRLWLQIALPTGSIDMCVAPVRHEELGAEEAPESWLIGARITKISESRRQRLIEYLQAQN